MSEFDTSASNEIHHIDGIKIVHDVRKKVKEQLTSPLGLITVKQDIFGNALDADMGDILASTLPQSMH